MKKALLVFAVVAALGLAALPGHAGPVNIVIAGFQYAPSGYVTADPFGFLGGTGTRAVPGAPVVRTTDTLVFTSADALPHTVTKDTGPLGTWAQKNFGLGSTASIPLTGFPVGTYTYKCIFHAGMKGSFIVTT